MRTSKLSNIITKYNTSTKSTPEEITLTSRQSRSFARTLKKFAAAEASSSAIDDDDDDNDDLKQSSKRERDDGAAVEKEEESKGDDNGNGIEHDSSSDLSSLSSTDLAVIEETVDDDLSSSRSFQNSISDINTPRRSPRGNPIKKVKLGSSAIEKPSPRRARPSSTRKALSTNLTRDEEDDKSQNEVTIHPNHRPPRDWLETYNTMKAMRSRIIAPVDTMGCERLADPTASPRVRFPFPSFSRSPFPFPSIQLTPQSTPHTQTQRFQTLLALMLSSQTKDTVTSAVIREMQRTLPSPGLTLETILSLSAQELNAHIQPVGFHNTKTRAILATAAILRDQHGSDIPSTYAGLVALPGVGPKMAHLCLSAAWGRTEGIGVDTHVLRITRRWGWHAAEKPEEARRCLEAWLPRPYWAEINVLLVGFGQMVCLPVGRRCAVCEVGSGEGKGRCPSRLVVGGEVEGGGGGEKKRKKGREKGL